MTRAEIDTLFAECEVYWPQGAPERSRPGWHKLLAPFDLEDALAALEAFADRGDEWPPIPGVLAERIRKSTRTPHRTLMRQMAAAGDWRAIHALADAGDAWAQSLLNPKAEAILDA